MLRFRKLKPADAETTDWPNEPLSALLPGGADFVLRGISDGETLIVIFEDGKPIGLLEMKKEPVGEKPRCAEVGLLVMLPEYRRHGLGRMLMCLAADEAVSRSLWFIAGAVPDTPEAAAFAKAIHMQQTLWLNDLQVLDLSDVEGLRYGNRRAGQ